MTESRENSSCLRFFQGEASISGNQKTKHDMFDREASIVYREKKQSRETEIDTFDFTLPTAERNQSRRETERERDDAE